MFTDGRQQRQPNHNTTTYCFTDGRQRQPNDNPIKIPPHIMLTDGRPTTTTQS